jgi:hypothetical protein
MAAPEVLEKYQFAILKSALRHDRTSARVLLVLVPLVSRIISAGGIDNVRRMSLAAFLCALAIVSPARAHAQRSETGSDDGPSVGRLAPVPPAVVTRDEAGAVIVRASRIALPMKIDGKLDEQVYAQIEAVTDFIQQEPREGQPSTERTDIWVLFDDENLYFACRCWEAHLDELVANDMRRDVVATGQHDHFVVALDTFQDRRNGFFFLVTPVGGTFDALVTDERAISGDWNTVWSSQAGRFEGGWTVEMAIPFKSLRYHSGRDQVWGLQVRRIIRHKNESAYLTRVAAAWGVGAILRMSRAATLVGLQAPPPGSNLEIKPYVVSDLRTDRQLSPPVSNEVGADVGLDVKYGITKSLTLDLTYNTDFAQVEADQAQVNLTRFSLFFPEKREFFLEGQGMFAFGGAGAFASGGENASSVLPIMFFSRRIGLNAGREVPIVAGARLTGKAGPYSLGMLNIQADDEPASATERTNFTVLRLRRDVLGRSTIGALVTRRSNALTADGSNVVFGADALFTFIQFLNINTYVAKSHTPGLRGKDLSYRAQVSYQADRYGLELERLTVEDNFNPEVGFMRRDNFHRHFAQARFSPRPRRAAVVRKYTYQASIDYITDTANTLESREAQGTFQIDLQSGDQITAEYTRSFELIEQPFTISESDGKQIPIGAYDFHGFRGSYSLGQQHRISGTASLEAGSFYHGDKTTAGFNGRVQVTTPLAIEPTVSFNWIDLPGGRFLTKLISTRTTYSMTPRMFVSALVQYSSTTTSLSANLRFRWEYRPGSELFIVYTEGRDTFPVRRIDLENRGFVVKLNRLFRF